MVTFNRTDETLDPTTGLLTISTSSITGSAIQVRPSFTRYRDLGLSLSNDITLLFTPSAYPLNANSDQFVLPGDKVSWNSQTYTVKDVDPVAPDGKVIVARIAIGIQ